MKYVPKVGDRLYTYTPCNSYYVNAVKKPWTVIEVRGNVCIVQAAECIFEPPVYYDTLPVSIVADPSGRTMKLRWSEKYQRWQESPNQGYPRVAVFGEYEYYPYLD